MCHIWPHMSKKSGSLRKNPKKIKTTLTCGSASAHLRTPFLSAKKESCRKRIALVWCCHPTIAMVTLDLDNFGGVFFSEVQWSTQTIYQRTSSWILTSKETKQNIFGKKKTRSSHYSNIKRRCFSPTRLRPSYLELPKGHGHWVIDCSGGVLYNPELSQIFKRIDVCIYEAYIYIMYVYNIFAL